MPKMSKEGGVEVGAVVSAEASALKPAEAMKTKFGAAATRDMRLSHLHVIGRTTLDNTPMLTLSHSEFPSTELYAALGSVRVEVPASAGQPYQFALPPSSVQTSANAQQQSVVVMPSVGVPPTAPPVTSTPATTTTTTTTPSSVPAESQAPPPQQAIMVSYAAPPATKAAATITPTTVAPTATTNATNTSAATTTTAATASAGGADLGREVIPPVSTFAGTSSSQPASVTDEAAPPELDALPEPSEGRAPVDDSGPFTVQFESVVRTELPNDGTLPTPPPNARAPTLMGVHGTSMLTVSRVFEHFLPTQWMQDVLLPLSNRRDPLLNLTLGELLRFIGMWLAIASHPERELHEFWTPRPGRKADAVFVSAPYLAPLMSQQRFRRIMAGLTLAPEEQLKRDRLCGVRAMIDAFNANMRAGFSPAAVSRVDEAHALWSHPGRPSWPCPLPNNRAAHPLGNRYHALGCATTNVIYALELQEQVPRPPTTPPLQHDECGSVGGLLLRLTQGLWGTHKTVVLGSELGTAQALGTLFDASVRATCHVDKRGGTWPRHVPADALLHSVDRKPVGSMAAVTGTMRRHHNAFPIMAAAVRGPEHVSLAMSTWVSLSPSSTVRRCPRAGMDGSVAVQYPEAFESLLVARDAVASNSALRVTSMPLETALPFTSWDMGQFAFLLALVETNAYFAFSHFQPVQLGRITRARFRNELIRQLVYNHLLGQEPAGTLVSLTGATTAAHEQGHGYDGPAAKRAKQAGDTGQLRRGRGRGSGSKRQVEVGPANSAHELCTAPLYSGKFLLGQWTKVSTKYNQHKCTGAGCTRKIRTYCSCDPTSFLCSRCFVMHYALQTALSQSRAGSQQQQQQQQGEGQRGDGQGQKDLGEQGRQGLESGTGAQGQNEQVEQQQQQVQSDKQEQQPQQQPQQQQRELQQKEPEQSQPSGDNSSSADVTIATADSATSTQREEEEEAEAEGKQPPQEDAEHQQPSKREVGQSSSSL